MDDLLYHSDRLYEHGVNDIKNSNLNARNKKLILDLADFLIAKGTTRLRIRTVYFPKLKIICAIAGKDLDKLLKLDVVRIVATIEKDGWKDKDGNKHEYSTGTFNHFVTILKVLFRWLNDLDDTEQLPKAVSWLKNKSTHSTLKKEDLLTEIEVNAMIEAADHPMWKALIAFLRETAVRPGELRSLRIKDIHYNGKNIKFYVRGKTKKKLGERNVYVYRSYKIITNWINSHPGRHNKDSFLWSKDSGSTPIGHQYMGQNIRRIGKLAGINRPVFCYLFRHTSITRAYEVLKEQELRRFAGHSESSRQTSRYTKFNEQDQEDAFARAAGNVSEKKEQITGTCPRCSRGVEMGEMICGFCGLALTVDAAISTDDHFSMEQIRAIKMLCKAIVSKPENIATIENMLREHQ